jgi:translation initiation factor 2 subunit 2
MAEENPTIDDQEVPDEVAAMFDLKQKKKKKKTTTKKADTAEDVEPSADNEGAAVSAGSSSEGKVSSSSSGGVSDMDPPQYTYAQLLNRVVDLLHANNPDLIEKRRYTMKPPQLMRGKYQ